VVIAPNDGTDYLYVPTHDAAVVKRVVRFLQSRAVVNTVFAAKRYGAIPGTLPAEAVYLENARRGPDIIISYAWDADAVVQGFPGTEVGTVSTERGQHGSFSPRDVHNTLIASGPDFQRAMRDPLPSDGAEDRAHRRCAAARHPLQLHRAAEAAVVRRPQLDLFRPGRRRPPVSAAAGDRL
jgi:hypothetical protein